MAKLGGIEVEITADNAGLGRGLRDSNKKLKDFGKRSKEELKKNAKAWAKWSKDTNSKLKGFQDRLKSTKNDLEPLGKAMGAVGKMSAALAAPVAAYALLANNIGRTNRELEVLARQAGTTTEDMRALGFATEQFGISGEQFADISKDMKDKLGEFSKVGTGAFQDYVDIMGLTKEAGQELAAEINTLSGQDGIQMLVSNMEAANVPAAQMTFVLESLGSDLSKLAPLFAENGKEADRLKGRFTSLVASIKSEDLQAYTKLTADMGLATDSFKIFLADALAPLAPAFSEASEAVALFFKELTEESQAADRVAEAHDKVNAILEKRAGRKKDPHTKTESEEANELILKNQKLQKLIDRRASDLPKNSKAARDSLRARQELAKTELAANEARIEQLAATSEKVTQVIKIYKDLNAEIEKVKSPKVEAPGVDTPTLTTPQAEALAQLKDRLKGERALAIEQFEFEKGLIELGVKDVDDRNKLIKQLESDHHENLKAIRKDGANFSQNELTEFTQALKNELKTREQLEIDTHKEVQGKIKAGLTQAKADKVASDEAFNAQELALEAEHQKALAALKGAEVPKGETPEGETLEVQEQDQSFIEQQQKEVAAVAERLAAIREMKAADDQESLANIEALQLAEQELTKSHELALKAIREQVVPEGDKYSPAQNEKFLEEFEAFMLTEEEAETRRFEAQQARLQEALDQQLTTEEDHQARLEKSKQAHEDKIAAIKSKATQATLAIASKGLAAAANLVTIFGNKNLKAQKGMAIASSGVAIAQGIAKAQELGFPANIGEMTRVAAVGKSVFSTIKGTQPGSAKLPSAPTSSSVPSSTASSISTPSTIAPNQVAQAETRFVDIKVEGEVFNPETVRNLIEKINEETGDGVVLRTD